MMRRIPDRLSFESNIIEFIHLGRGRFKEESNYIVNLNGERLCVMKVFRGRGYYKPWIELYSFTKVWERLKQDRRLLKSFFKFFSCVLDEGESLFIEYYHDPELTRELERSIDVGDTFLGKILSEVGFKKFRDWYIPEGMMEGGQKFEAWK